MEVQDVGDKIKDAAGSAKDAVKDAAGNVKDAAGSAAEKVFRLTSWSSDIHNSQPSLWCSVIICVAAFNQLECSFLPFILSSPSISYRLTHVELVIDVHFLVTDVHFLVNSTGRNLCTVHERC